MEQCVCCLVTELQQQQPAHTLSDNEQAKGAQITVLSVPFGAVPVRVRERELGCLQKGALLCARQSQAA